jgi:predicted amidohydrolase
MTNVKYTIDRCIERGVDWDAFWDLGSGTFSSHVREGIERVANGVIWDQIVDELHNKIRISMSRTEARSLARLRAGNFGFIS